MGLRNFIATFTFSDGSTICQHYFVRTHNQARSKAIAWARFEYTDFDRDGQWSIPRFFRA